MTNLHPFKYALDEYNRMNPIAVGMSRDKTMLTRMFKHQHLLEFIERIDYKNLPPELNKDLIERILYFRFKGAMFKYNEKFYFLPFALKGTLDMYGRYNEITPVLFTGQWSENKKDEPALPAAAGDIGFKVRYDKSFEPADDVAVILTDSSLEVSQDFIPMDKLIEPLIEQQTDIMVLLNIDLVSSAKTFYIVAQDEDQKASIEAEFATIDQRILNGKRVVVVVNDVFELKELKGTNGIDSAKYFQSFQSVTNLRKAIIGLDNGGTFLKQEHMTDNEINTNTQSSNLVLANALRQRKEFCELINHYFGLNVSVEITQDSGAQAIAEEGSQTKQKEPVNNERGEE